MILATGRRAKRARGFTLLEVMLVLLLIGLASSVIVMSLPDNHYRAEREAQRLAERINALARTAALEGRTYGLWVASDRWQLKAWRQNGWHDLPWPEARRGQQLPDGWRLALSVPSEAAPDVPQVLLLPGGDITPFQLRYMTGSDAVVMLAPGDDGWIAVTERQHDAP